LGIPKPATSIAIEEVIETICGIRAERFPFEKIVALITFSVWLNWPDKPEIVRQGRLIAIAHLILALNDNELPTSKKRATVQKIIDEAFDPIDTAEALVQRELEFGYWEQFQSQIAEHGDVESIARFIISCPKEYTPSLNKALFFISEGGFANEESEQPYKPSIATLKKSWVRYAPQAAFILAEELCLESGQITMLPPDDGNSIDIARHLLGEQARVRDYFGKAKYLQDLLQSRLDRVSQKRFSFVTLPDNIQPVTADLPILVEWQLEIVKKYRAPKSL
jgi:hypothetical protein